MSSNKSKIIISGLTITILGFLGYVLFGGKKPCEGDCENVVEETDSRDKIKPVNKVIAHEYTTPEELILDLLVQAIEEKRFSSSGELLGILVTRFSMCCPDLEWFSDVPKNVGELEEFMRCHGIFEKYVVSLFPKA